jgi:hypothetical protein
MQYILLNILSKNIQYFDRRGAVVGIDVKSDITGIGSEMEACKKHFKPHISHAERKFRHAAAKFFKDESG